MKTFVPIIAAAAISLGPAASAALFTGIELYYSFDNDSLASGGIADLSGNSRNGSPNDVNNLGTTDFSFSADVPAVLGSGMSLRSTGADNILADSTAYPGVLGSQSRTVAAWVRIDPVVGTGVNMHVVEWGVNTAGNRWTLRRENAQTGAQLGTLRTEIQTDFRVGATGSPSLNDGNWHHVATVFDNTSSLDLTQVTMYLDGIAIASYLDGANTPNVNTTNGGPLAVAGSSSFADRQWNGWIDEVGIWGRALSAAEIGQLAAGATIPEPSYPLLLVVLAGTALSTRRRRRCP